MELEKEEIKKRCFELAEKWCRLNTAEIPRQSDKAIISQMAQIENEIEELVNHRRCNSWEIINYYWNCKYLKGKITIGAEQWLDFYFFGIVPMNRYVLKRCFPVTFRNSYHKY